MIQILRGLATLIFAAALGAAIWALSSPLVGAAEPWDGPGWYYPTALFIAGLLGAALWPSRFVLAPIGVSIGQIAYVSMFLKAGPLWPIGLLFGITFLAFAIAGSATTFAIWYTLWRFMHRRARSAS